MLQQPIMLKVTNFDYIASAPRENLLAALPDTKPGGPDGICLFAITTRGSRCKIPKLATKNGSKVEPDVVKRYDASKNKQSFIKDNELIIFDGWNDREVEMTHIVLCLHKNLQFNKLVEHESNRDKGDEKWVIAHQCHMGNENQYCMTVSHLFVATNSVNQKQRVCSTTGQYVCESCGYAPKRANECQCSKLINPPDTVPNCITQPIVAGIIPELQMQIKELESKYKDLESKYNKIKDEKE